MRIVRQALGWIGRLAPGPSSALAERMFLTPPRFRPPVREDWWATEAESFEVPADGGPLAAWSWGRGERTVLLVHGWGGRGLQLGFFAEPLVAAGFRVVAFDGPAHGRSPGRRSSLPAMAAAIRAVTRHLGGAHGLVAHSFGAASTVFALAQGGLPVARLVFVAPPAELPHVTARFGELTGFPPPVVERMRRRIEGRFGISFGAVQGLTVAPAMDRPLLVLHDRRDREIPWRQGQLLADAWPGAELASSDGLGHYRILRDPGTAAKAVDFLGLSWGVGRVA